MSQVRQEICFSKLSPDFVTFSAETELKIQMLQKLPSLTGNLFVSMHLLSDIYLKKLFIQLGCSDHNR